MDSMTGDVAKSWQTIYYERLKQNDKRIQQPFKACFEEIERQRKEISSLRADNARLLATGGGGLGNFTPSGSSELLIKERQAAEHFKDKYTKILEEKNDIQTASMQLHQQMHDKELALKKKDDVIDLLKQSERRLTNEVAVLKKRLQDEEERHTSQMLEQKDINTINQHELQTFRIQITGLQKELQKSKLDCTHITEKYLAHVKAEADALNQQNYLEEKEREKNRTDHMMTAIENRPANVSLSEEGYDIVNHPPASMSLPPNRLNECFQCCEGAGTSVAYSPSGSFLVTGGEDNRVGVWNSSSPTKTMRKHVLVGANGSITSVNICSDDENLVMASSSNDWTVRIWNMKTQKILTVLTGHNGPVNCASFLSKSHAVSGGGDRIVKVWDLTTRNCLQTKVPPSGSTIHAVSKLTDRQFISGHFNKTVLFWDMNMESPSGEQVIRGRVTSLCVSPDTRTLLITARDSAESALYLYDFTMSAIRAHLTHDDFKLSSDLSRACFSPDGRFVAAGSNDGSLFIWDANSQKLEKSFPPNKKQNCSPIYAVAWQPGTVGAVACVDKGKKCNVWLP